MARPKAEQAYRRGDALEKRRKLMKAWASYCEPTAAANVVQTRKQKTLVAVDGAMDSQSSRAAANGKARFFTRTHPEMTEKH
jgi:hypothetical protein